MNDNTRYWDDLSIEEKSAMIKAAVDNGITELPVIKQKYNEFAEGGDTNNSWTMADEAGFQEWRASLPDNLRYTKDSDYDMRGAYNAGIQPHWVQEKDGTWTQHLGTRDPKTGLVLTHTIAAVDDAIMGYHPYTKNGREYTDTWIGNERVSGLLNPEKPPIPYKFAEGGNLYDGTTESSNQMQLGRDYWQSQVAEPNWYDTIDPPVNGKPLQEIIVTPTDDQNWLFSQGKYARNIRQTLADESTRKVVAKYLSRYDNEDAAHYNDRVTRLADAIYRTNGVIFKSNDVKEGKFKNRAHYNPNEGIAYVNSVDELFSELAHPYQDWLGNNRNRDEYVKGYDADIDPRGGTRYAYPDTYEGETHGFFEPALSEYITTGKISRSLPMLNKTLSDEKITPKDWKEVTDSAASWDKQAIDRRIISMPSQLPLFDRIKYSVIDYPLLEKSKYSAGGNLYQTGGGIKEGKKRGDKVDTAQCATWSNGLLRQNGYIPYGNAWALGNVDMLFNGFDSLSKPEVFDRAAVEKYNHAAADSVYKNFDSKTLDKTKPYIVNMFYNNSPALEDAYKEGKGVTGTHTGVLTWEEPKNRWMVTHNIHGVIHQEPFVQLQNGNNQYGVTAVYAPRENNLVNRVKGFLGFADGGNIHIKKSNRGKFTALKERTGHSASWFKAHGTPAQKKMAIFELNARKWKHGLGGNLFSGEENYSSKMNQGRVYDVLPELLRNAGLNIRVTSGYRKPGQAGKAGSKSWHTHHGAVDIVPQGNTTFEDIENVIYSDPVISRYMLDNGFGLLDESGRTAESKATMKKTGATGAHFHIGKDSKPAAAYRDRMSAIMANTPQTVQTQDVPLFMPMDPRMYNLDMYKSPMPIIDEPIVQETVESPYSKETLEREEKLQGLRNLNFLTGLMRDNDSSNQGLGLLGTINMLTN